ncbi:MAG: hypothetical protein HWN66_09725 [Candidatus Helarchaeota archaeon]|nr:hypothetical protein [Candidatus Helarchaeota archaeon]
MSSENLVISWLRSDFLENWKQILKLNKKFNNQEAQSLEECKLIFPFIPIEADGYSVHNFTALILKYLFPLNSDFLIIILNKNNDSILWAGFQKTEQFSFTELIELDKHLEELTSFLNLKNKEEKLSNLQNLLKKNGISSTLSFYLLLNSEVVSDFKKIYENHSNLLEFYSQIWNLMAKYFKQQTLQFYPEPLFFKFFRRLTTKNFTLNATEFENFLGNLLPIQNLVMTFLDQEYPSCIAFITKQDRLQIQFIDHKILQNYLADYAINQEKGLEYLNKLVKNKIRLLIKNEKVRATTAITITEDIWVILQDIMTHYSFEYLLDRFFQMSQMVEEKWTMEQKIVLFKRWGKAFMSFQLNRLIPTQISTILTSILSFNNPAQTRTVWFIINDSFELLYILGINFKAGLFNRIYMISNPKIFELFNSEPDKALGVRKAHFYFAENENWIDQIIVITAQDLNLLIAFVPLLTSIKGSLKYLKMIENIITYRMYFYPNNFFADLISRKGAIYFFKNIMFPLVLNNADFNRQKSTN